MLKKIWNARWYWALGCIIFLCTLIVTAPLHFIWRFVEPKLANLPVQISQPQGSLWNGRAQVSSYFLPSFGRMQVQWQLAFWPLFKGQAQIDLRVEGESLRVEGPVFLSQNSLRLEHIDGYLDLQALRPMLQAQRADISGAVELSKLNLQVQLNPTLVQAISGRMNYAGGNVSLLVDNNPVSASLPMLVGNLAMQGDKAQVEITTTEGQSVLSGYLQPDGWGGVALKRRFIDLLGQPWPVSAEPDSVIFEVSHKLL